MAEEKIQIPRRKFLKTFLGGAAAGSALTAFPILKIGMRIGKKLEQNTTHSHEIFVPHTDNIYLRKKFKFNFTSEELSSFEKICQITNSSPFHVRQLLLMSVHRVPKEECPIPTELVNDNGKSLDDLKKRLEDVDKALGGKPSSYNAFRRLSPQKLARVSNGIQSEITDRTKNTAILIHFAGYYKAGNTPERSILEKIRDARFGKNPAIPGGKKKIFL